MYREENDSVILTMSREDYDELLTALRDWVLQIPLVKDGHIPSLGLMDRLNSGNPNYTPYQVGEKKP